MSNGVGQNTESRLSELEQRAQHATRDLAAMLAAIRAMHEDLRTFRVELGAEIARLSSEIAAQKVPAESGLAYPVTYNGDPGET